MPLLRKAGLVWTGVLLGIVVLAGLLLATRWVLPLLSTRPELLSSAPLSGTPDVPPLSRVTLRFSAPMNPRTVERALRVDPPLSAELLWNAERTALTISPTLTLRPETRYQVTVDERALSRSFAELMRPVRLDFTTAAAPAVLAVLPADGSQAVPLDGAVSVRFSRPIMPPDALARPDDFAELRFDPPLAGSATWVDQATVLFRPSEPLQAGTRYRATLDAALSDTAGVPLGQRFEWSFATAQPRVLAVAPPANAQGVAPRAPLTLRLSQPFDLAAIRSSLTITPAVAGAWDAATLPDATQLVTFTPDPAWQPGTRYAAELRAGAAPLAGNMPLAPAARWGFQTAPQPQLIGRFPGEGQILPAGQPIRLIFNTPVDPAALQGALRFSPPADRLQVSASETEARIEATLRASTLYTVTLPPDLVDRNGVALGQEYQLRLQTAPAAPALLVPPARGHLLPLLPGAAALPVQRTNLTALDVELYQLDEAATVRALAFDEREWASFSPARAGQPLLRRWRVPVSDTLNTPTAGQLALEPAEGEILPPGAYFVRIRTPEGPRADLLVLLSPNRLLLQHDRQSALVWATDALAGTPVAQLPVALYRDGALIERGVTDARGLWSSAVIASDARSPLIVVAGGAAPAVASAAWSAAPPRPAGLRAWLTTSSPVYRPGNTVGLAGVVRALGEEGLAAPPRGQLGTLTLRRAGQLAPLYDAPVAAGPTGVISAAFTLPADAPPGLYSLTLSLGGSDASVPFRVAPSHAALSVEVLPPEPPAAGQPASLRVAVRGPDGLPVAGSQISWTLQISQAGWPTDPVFSFGDPEAPAQPDAFRQGSGMTDSFGTLTVVVTDTAGPAGRPLRYRLLADARGPGRLSGFGEGGFVAAPAAVELGLSLPDRILPAGDTRPVELLTRAPGGQPLANQSVRVQVFRRDTGRDELVLARSVTSGADGRATLPLTLARGGLYRVLATAADRAGRQVAAAAPLWVAAPGFNAWPPGGLALVADRSSYRPGDTARLLLASPFAEAEALVTVQRSAGLTATLQRLRPGEPLSVAILPDDPPLLHVAVALSQPQAGRAGPSPEPLAVASAALPLLSAGEGLTVTLVSDRPSYTPGATALLTVTTTDARGQAVPADILLSAVDPQVPDEPLGALFGGVRPAPLQTAQFPGGEVEPPQPVAALALAGATGPVEAGWRAGLRTGTDGVLRVELPLPQQPQDITIQARAAAPAAFGQARLTLPITAPLQLLLSPPQQLRAGDATTLSAQLRNTSPQTQTVRLVLNASGLRLAPRSAPVRQLLLRPGQSARVSWPAQASDAGRATISLLAQPSDGASVSARADWPILPASGTLLSEGGARVSGTFTQSIELAQGAETAWGRLMLSAAPSEWALAERIAQGLVALPEHSALDDAGLLLVAVEIDRRHMRQPALDRLVAAQQSDGGWGWWRSDRSDLFVTAAVLEALAAAQRADDQVPEHVIERGTSLLQRHAPAHEAQPALRAYVQYVLSLHSLSDAVALRELAAQPQRLGASGLAYLLLARSPGLDDNRPLVELLAGLASRSDAGIFWDGQADAALPTGGAETTALAARALERHRPDSDLLPEARRWLLGAHRIDGWGGPLANAHVLAALLRHAGRPGGYQVALNGALLLDASGALTATRQLTLTLDQLRPRNTLAVTGTLLLSYRLEQDGPAASDGEGIGLLRTYHDPLTGQPLDPAGLGVGQLVEVRLTAVNHRPRSFVTIEEPLPGGAALLDAGGGALAHTEHGGGALRLEQASLAPGIYEQRYLLRLAAPGRYSAPPPSAWLLGQGSAGRGNATTLVVR